MNVEEKLLSLLKEHEKLDRGEINRMMRVGYEANKVAEAIESLKRAGRIRIKEEGTIGGRAMRQVYILGEPTKKVGKPTFTLEPMPGKVISVEDEFKTGYSEMEIPDSAKIRPTTSTVISVGKDVENVKVGDHIIFGQFSGTMIQFKGQPAYRILGPDEVLAKIVGEVELEAIEVG